MPQYNIINNQNIFLNSNFKVKGKWNIIFLLKNNPNITSYIHIIDYLTCEELLNMFSFYYKILNFSVQMLKAFI